MLDAAVAEGWLIIAKLYCVRFVQALLQGPKAAPDVILHHLTALPIHPPQHEKHCQ